MNELLGRTRNQDDECHQVCGNAHEEAKPDAPSVPYGTWVFELTSNGAESSAYNGSTYVWVGQTGHASVEEAERATSFCDIRALRQKDAPEADKRVEVEGRDESPDGYQQRS